MSASFPGELQKQLDMPCVPQCTLCHRDANGGIGTAVKPFGVAMQDAGLKLKEPALIAKALGVLEENRYDSDSDGVTDVDELREGRNPNQSGEGVLCATYGCGARIARGSDAGGGEPAVMLLLALAGFALGVRVRRAGSQRIALGLVLLAAAAAALSGCYEAPAEAELRIKVIDAAERTPIAGAIVSMEKGGIYRTNPDPSRGNPSFVYGARADDQGTLRMTLATDLIGVHTFAGGYFYGSRLVELDQDLGVTINMESFSNKSPTPLPPTIQNHVLMPAIVSPGSELTVSADVMRGDADDPLSEEVIVTFPAAGMSRALDPPSPGIQGKMFPDGRWSTTLVAPDEPGLYEYFLSATSEHCVTSDVQTLTLEVQ